SAITALIRVRMASLGLVGALGFLLLVSLAVSSGLQAAASYLHTVSTVFDVVLRIITFLISFALITVMFAAIYKVLPDRQVEWRDVLTGAVVTALLFTIGKFLISLYIGGAAIASTYGAAGSLLVFLIWVYYSAQIFLFGAEFTRAFAETKGSDAPQHQQVGIPDQPGDMKPTSQVGSVKP
ncbi:MAG: YihY/virulence factor BrkB family protein, partial [Acetobacteraceae bacterium]|nr:YihY/virulence factor BrkB family protein [Acetobacteraceae bacterium]